MFDRPTHQVNTVHPETQYLELLRDIMDNGVVRDDRTGVGTKGVFGRQIRFDLAQGFPLLTTKKIHFKSVVHELLWFLAGDTNIRYLQENGVRIWNEWADEEGNLGCVYGKQWRRWEGIDGKIVDQISQLITGLRQNPYSRRHVVSAWNPAEVENMALPPCHCLFQFYVSEGKLSCQLYQRSADVFLGVPFNIASYALLTHMVAQCVDLEVGEYVHSFGDVHLYLNHFEQARTQLERPPLALPSIKLVEGQKDIFAFKYDDIALENYSPHPALPAPVAV